MATTLGAIPSVGLAIQALATATLMEWEAMAATDGAMTLGVAVTGALLETDISADPVMDTTLTLAILALMATVGAAMAPAALEVA